MKKTGTFKKDAAGLWHYVQEEFWNVHEAIKFAISEHPKDAPSWFWFNDTPAPILENDTDKILLTRWEVWRSLYQDNPDNLLELLRNLV